MSENIVFTEDGHTQVTTDSGSVVLRFATWHKDSLRGMTYLPPKAALRIGHMLIDAAQEASDQRRANP